MKSPRRSTESLAIGARKGVATYDRLEAEGPIGSVYGVAVGPRSLASCGGSGSDAGTGCPGALPGTRGSRLPRSNSSSPHTVRGERSTSAAGRGRTRCIWHGTGGPPWAWTSQAARSPRRAGERATRACRARSLLGTSRRSRCRGRSILRSTSDACTPFLWEVAPLMRLGWLGWCVRAVLRCRHARVHASVHEMRRAETARGFPAGATRRTEAADVVPGMLRGVRAGVLPQESRGTEGAPATKHGGETCRQQAPNDRIPSSPSLRRLRRGGHRGPAVRSPGGQGTRSLEHARQRLEL